MSDAASLAAALSNIKILNNLRYGLSYPYTEKDALDYILFIQNPNIVLTKEQILGRLWDCDSNFIDSITLTAYIRRLRMIVIKEPDL